MAQIKQIGTNPVLTLPCKNTSGSDLAEGIVVMLDTYVAGQYSVKLTASDVGAMGVTAEAIANGKIGRVIVAGVASCTASATITSAGGTAVVMADSAGKVLPQTAAKYQVGFALQDAVSTDRVAVLLAFAKNA
jgi:precorrin-4 methylase